MCVKLNVCCGGLLNLEKGTLILAIIDFVFLSFITLILTIVLHAIYLINFLAVGIDGLLVFFLIKNEKTDTTLKAMKYWLIFYPITFFMAQILQFVEHYLAYRVAPPPSFFGHCPCTCGSLSEVSEKI